MCIIKEVQNYTVSLLKRIINLKYYQLILIIIHVKLKQIEYIFKSFNYYNFYFFIKLIYFYQSLN